MATYDIDIKVSYAKTISIEADDTTDLRHEIESHLNYDTANYCKLEEQDYNEVKEYETISKDDLSISPDDDDYIYEEV